MGLKAFGSKLQYDEGGASFVDIPGVISVDGPTEKADTIETTDLDSPNNSREHIEGLVDGGEVSVEINYEPGNTVQEAIRDKKGTPASDYKINFPNGKTANFAALVTSFEPSFTYDGKLTANFTLKTTGLVTVT